MRHSDLVYTSLRQDIVEWRLAPGHALNEAELTERFSVSRTPVREALQRLAREGLVDLRLGRGASVSEISLEDLVQLVQMREALESYSARLCARRADRSVFEGLRTELELCRDEIHDHQVRDGYEEYYALITRFDEAVAHGTGNQYLVAALADLRGHLYRLRRISRHRAERMAATTDEHLAICVAICDGDEVAAVQATSIHIHNSFKEILAALRAGVVGPVLDRSLVPSGPDVTSISGAL